MKHSILVSIVLLSLSSYAFCADTQTKQPDSTVKAPPQSGSAPQQAPADKKIADKAKTPEQQSIADFCRTHTC